MEEVLAVTAGQVALAVETVAVLLAAFGAASALLSVIVHLVRGSQRPGWGRGIWATFGGWLLASLQFALAADIVRSAISPSWEQIGQLAAIAAIRTFLGYFLEKDLLEIKRLDAEAVAVREGAQNL